MPLGLIIFLLFNKYLGILSVLESKRHLTYAGHLAALMGNGSLLSPPTLCSLYQADSHAFPPLVALTRVGGERDAECLC